MLSRVACMLTAAVLAASLAFAGKAQTVTLDVPNMTCPLCPITVRKALEKVPGVSAAKVDFDKKTASVTFDPDRTNAGALIKATTDAGYPSGVHR